MHETGRSFLQCNVTIGYNPADSSESVEQVALALCLTKPLGLYPSLQVFHSVPGIWRNSTIVFPVFFFFFTFRMAITFNVTST